MKIKQEDFDKLSQLDRIEYRQIFEMIKERNPFLSIFITSINWFLFALVYVFSLCLLLYISNPLFFNLIQDKIIKSIIGFYFIPIIGTIIAVFLAFRYKKEIEILNSKYFDFQVKTKHRK